ncbi:MAG: DNA polymerase IV [Oscillospiraceae bacterium]|jgi:DNA polymerase-4|nr:DNA polymerase IV [Oscillospiraceae bacterium]
MSERTIFHCDCNSFFASVEETFNPQYKSVPMAVAGDPASRHGIILAKNELAKKYNIKTAETVWSARKKCPNLVLCPPRRGVYSEVCERVNAIYAEYTDRVERFGVDESWLDMTMFADSAEAFAGELRRRVAEEIGITISVGVSWNKIFSKLGSDYKKPDATTVITRENYREIVFPLPVTDLFMVGRNTAESLAKLGIHTIGQLAQCDADYLASRFGKLGEVLHRNANGLDDGAVAHIGESEPVKSVGNGMTFRRDLVTMDDIRAGVNALTDSVAARLRAAGMKCATVQVTIKDSALKSIQRQKGVATPTFVASEIAKTALEIIEASWQIGKPIRMLTVTAQNLVPPEQAVEQLTLFGDGDDDAELRRRKEQLERAVDALRGKYGSRSLRRGAANEDLGIK